ncbi:LemA protein [Desulfosalsimonas propionicica]|uniref:LemA protein n=1 Tax=Desulfosalsimonas propionicica TaxID=332175 RepID=A0A7W0CBE2_9BACT|nr:LemA family protein [Desulfosalsimonas propionicica]MBA2882643.1 LemA protein [Desulfosalsimonas propionicica]
MSTIILLILLGVIVALIIYLVVIFNGLVRLKHNIDRAWSNIDVLLKQRYDELPKLVRVCEGYMQHERAVLENVTRARAQLDNAGSGTEVIEANNAISQALRSLFAVVENYPDLKADQAFRQLQSRVSQLEDQIADRRELYNDSVNLFNIRIEQFPDVFVANMMKLVPRQLWQIEPEHRRDVEISFNMA